LVCETLLVLEKDPSAPLLAELRPVQIDGAARISEVNRVFGWQSLWLRGVAKRRAGSKSDADD
jgi:hypothetical protein